MVGNALEADKAPTIPQASGPGIRSMVFGPDSSLLAVGSYDGIIRLFNGRTGSLLASLYTDQGGDWLALSPKGYFSGSDWGIYSYLRISSGEGLREIGDGEMGRLDGEALVRSFQEARLGGNIRRSR